MMVIQTHSKGLIQNWFQFITGFFYGFQCTLVQTLKTLRRAAFTAGVTVEIAEISITIALSQVLQEDKFV